MFSLEVSESPFEANKEHILRFINDYSSHYVSKEREDEILQLTSEIIETGIKRKDAVHLACSMIAECDYFITTDKRVIKYRTSKIKIINPIEFVKTWREQYDG